MNRKPALSRRALLKGMGWAPLLWRPAALMGGPFRFGIAGMVEELNSTLPFAEMRLKPSYPAKSPLEDVLRHVKAGSDGFVTERYAYEIEGLLAQVSRGLRGTAADLSVLGKIAAPGIEGTSLAAATETTVRTGGGIQVVNRRFSGTAAGREKFVGSFKAWLGTYRALETAEIQVVGLEVVAEAPLRLKADMRYDFVFERGRALREERVGLWHTEWTQNSGGAWQAVRWLAEEETAASVRGPGFLDVTEAAMGSNASYHEQMLRGADYWRTVLDGACGIDVYGNNGVALGDYDNDGLDDLYVCQPSGLPNRLYRNRGDGTFEDVTEKAGVGVLDGTACALFADFDNRGLQDLLVVCASGPLLFVNQGDGRFTLKRGAFQFKTQPQGAFTHAALADYDRDGRLDIYLCTYSYYVGLDQYHYPIPYYDARNGPANYLLHNEGNGSFVDKTEAAGLNAENDRYSFACAWGDADGDGFPDLYVANDFGRGNLYRNNGDGTFTARSTPSHINDPGAGMSATWSDYKNDGRSDVYVANMWSAAGQRVAQQTNFHPDSPDGIRAHYRRHARGNALYRNEGDGTFRNVSQSAGVEMGRWAWGSDFWDFDQDGFADLYIANGYISAADHDDLGSFFWRQVVAKSPDDATPSLAYEHGWNALNELIRSDSSWSGYERNVLFANNHNGTFAEVSGALGMDFVEDSRSFVLADLDQDGRLEVLIKNRNAPQLRVLRNGMEEIGHSIVLRLRGQTSNRDAIGAVITMEAGTLRQTRSLQAGSGFLMQHTKEVFFGVGAHEGTVHVTVRWPNGLLQQFDDVPVGHRIEIEEGVVAFKARPFKATAVAYLQPDKTAVPEPLPADIATWLLQPLKAPDFSLSDGPDAPVRLSSLRGSIVLLSFWSIHAPYSLEQLEQLARNRVGLDAARIKTLAISVDAPRDVDAAKATAGKMALPFPSLYATEEVAGLYNIIYRYLFDRRRDLGIPSSFLIDADGMIVRLYQGRVDPRQVIEDVKAAPAQAEERVRRAIPFEGTLYQSAFERNDFTYGVAYFQHGYLEQAAESFQQVVAAKPDDPEGYYNLGTLNLRRNNFPEAKRYLEKTLQLRPNYPEAWNNLGMMAAQEGNADEAERNFTKSLELRPGYAIALLNLGNVYRRQGRADKALDALTQALKLQPDDPEMNYSLGMFYAQQNQPDRAGEYLRKALTLRPDYPEAMNNLGVLFVRALAYDKAEAQFQECIRVAPEFDQSYLNLARLYALQGDKVRAKQVLLALEQKQPQNPSARRALEMLESVR